MQIHEYDFPMYPPPTIEITECLVRGIRYSGSLVREGAQQDSGWRLCGHSQSDVVGLIGAVEMYRKEGGVASYYSLPNVFHLLRDHAQRCEKKALDWEAKCRLKDEEISRLRAARKRMTEYIGAYLSEEVKP